MPFVHKISHHLESTKETVSPGKLNVKDSNNAKFVFTFILYRLMFENNFPEPLRGLKMHINYCFCNPPAAIFQEDARIFFLFIFLFCKLNFRRHFGVAQANEA